jgi:hypothetical protein
MFQFCSVYEYACSDGRVGNSPAGCSEPKMAGSSPKKSGSHGFEKTLQFIHFQRAHFGLKCCISETAIVAQPRYADSELDRLAGRGLKQIASGGNQAKE